MNLTKNIYLGLGSNSGNRISNLKKALKVLANCQALKVSRVSSFYQTSPVGPRQRDFVNAVVKAECAMPPMELLKFIKKTEKQLGRVKGGVKWGPRKIDIDILFFGNEKLVTGKLTIPHPEIQNRLFVLVPLSEIATRMKHPVLKMPISRLIKMLLLTSQEQKVKIISNG